MKYIISAPRKAVQDTIYIPSSKSISNRLLVIRALAGSDARLENLSDSDDTRIMQEVLGSGSSLWDVGHAGTAMRFLTALAATGKGTTTITGSERMKQRPIGPLVTALRELGASIDYLEEEGCPPLKITGGGLRGGEIRVEAGISSQFISALMMIGPVLPGGMRLSLDGEMVSGSYIGMTMALMNQCGAGARWSDESPLDAGGESGEAKGKIAGARSSNREIYIPGNGYRVGDMVVESDWSAASYWFQVAALSDVPEIRLPNLYQESLQGDAVSAGLFGTLGVSSHFTGGGLILSAGDKPGPVRSLPWSYDFTECPDLVQTFAVTLCCLGIPFRMTGTRTLRIKETDRISALERELGRLGYRLSAATDGSWLIWDGTRMEPSPEPVIETYHDHRMAMAFAPAAIRHGRLTIDDPMVVTKSYPGFWSDLEKAGFSIEKTT